MDVPTFDGLQLALCYVWNQGGPYFVRIAEQADIDVRKLELYRDGHYTALNGVERSRAASIAGRMMLSPNVPYLAQVADAAKKKAKEEKGDE